MPEACFGEKLSGRGRLRIQRTARMCIFEREDSVPQERRSDQTHGVRAIVQLNADLVEEEVTPAVVSEW